MIPRQIEKNILENLHKGKVIILLGARQTGKTTLLKQLTNGNQSLLWLNGDESDVQAIFHQTNSARLKAFIGDNKTVVIDEAQRIPNISLCIKLIKDNFSEIQIIATGSSSFELLNKVNEPLTGRKWEYNLFPISFEEMVKQHGLLTEKRLLFHRLVYGYYPEVINAEGNQKQILKSLTDRYLYKDILLYDGIKKPDKLNALLKALALQVGQQVSYNELGQLVGLDSKTIESYIHLLEQSFIVYRLPSFSRNLRNELKFSKKIYFYDNGIRNAIINDFREVENRTDVGSLWENFLITERLKSNHYSDKYVNRYFWRTKEQKEVDYIEEYDGRIDAYEFKWNSKKIVQKPLSFQTAYPDSAFNVITPDNFEAFLIP
jgi:uncharacterized protein